MKTKKGILKKFCIFIITILILTNPVLANQEQQEDKYTNYDLENIGIKISLEKNWIEMVSSLKNNGENVSNIENKEEYMQNYKNAGIILDAVDNIENPTKEILIAKKTSSSYINMANFNDFSEEEKNTYKEKLLETFKEQANQNENIQFNIKENSIIKTANGNNYINVKSELKTQDKTLEMSIYYTIANGRLITISFRNYQTEDKEIPEEKQIIENIEIYEVQRPKIVSTNEVMRFAIGFTVIAFIILAIIVIIIRIKDRKYLDKNIKDVKIKQYSKFGGIILFFWTLCFYQIFLRVVEINNVSKIEGMDFYVIAITIQSTILAIINMYQIYVTVQRKPETPKKIIGANITIMATGLIITIIRIIYAWINPMESYNKEYFKQEFNVLLFSILYPMLCATYFTFSKRVQTYYYLPKKGYKEIWKDLINKKGVARNEK